DQGYRQPAGGADCGAGQSAHGGCLKGAPRLPEKARRDEVPLALPTDIMARRNNLVVKDQAAARAAFGALAVGAMALGALAVGALAVGVFAIGHLAIGRLAMGRARIKRLEIDELVVGRIRRK